LIIRLIIQTILLYPSGAVKIDAEHPSRNRKVVDFLGPDQWDQ